MLPSSLGIIRGILKEPVYVEIKLELEFTIHENKLATLVSEADLLNYISYHAGPAVTVVSVKREQ